jgi:DNA-3-methyladenine glycosylase II
LITLDHPAWLTRDGQAFRVVRDRSSNWLVHCDYPTASRVANVAPPTTGSMVTRLAGRSTRPPVFDSFDPHTIAAHAGLVKPLRRAGLVHRLRNPDLWDALANAIIRQVIRAGHARVMYGRFCREFGQRIATPLGDVYLIPEPGVVAGLSNDAFTQLGMAFKASALRDAARAYLVAEKNWLRLSAPALLVAVQTVPRVGPWTAGAAVADYTGDYGVYPFADLAVRTWAAKLAPALNLPAEEGAFAERWNNLANGHLAELTLLTLAWGARYGQRSR